MKHIFLFFLLSCIAQLCAASADGGFKIRKLTEFMDAGNILPGKFKMEIIAPDIAKLTPEPGTQEIILELKEARKIDDSSAWFSIPLYPVSGKNNPTGCKVSLVTPSGLGENGIQTTTFPYRRDQRAPRGWENLISENTLHGMHESRRKGMKVKTLKFRLVPGVEAVYFKTPQLYSNTLVLPSLVSAYGKTSNTWYGEMAPILPFRYRSGKYECTLSMQDGFQKKPFYETVKQFDFGAENDASFNPVKALDGFELPVMPAGSYWCRLLFRDPASGKILGESEFDYQVLASQVKTMPEFPDRKIGSWPIVFEADSPDFIFGVGKNISGKIQLGDLSRFLKNGERIHLLVRLEEYRHTESRMPLETYYTGTMESGASGGTLRLDIPLKSENVSQDTAFQLVFQVMTNGKTLASASYTVGVRGDKNTYVPPSGKLRTWQEMFRKPMIGEGPHPLKWMHREEMEIFAAKIAKEGYSEFVDIDCMWSGNTEPLPGFYTFGYIDRFLNVLRKHGLYAILHTSGIDQPKWSVFQNIPSRLHDGRFLRGDTWNPAPSNYEERRAKNIQDNIVRLGKRYANDPAVGFWVFWGYGGEGFTPDWALSWRYGGGVSGYCESGAKVYREYIRSKYKTLNALNSAYGTAYANWDVVALPLPPVEKETKTKLRNPRPAYSLPYEDFKAAKENLQRDYFERFIAKDFRKIDPHHPFAIYYYGDAETEYMRPSPGFYKNNPGLIQRNGGNEIAGVWNKQYMHFRAYENTPTMSEDVSVYADTVKDWQSNVFNGSRIGRLGVHFFNYSLIMAQMKNGKPEVYHTDHHHPAIAKFFQGLRKNALPVLGMTEPMPPGVAVYYNYYDNVRTGTCPANELFRSRYLAEPINDRFVDRLEKHYKVLALDSGAQVIPEKAAKKIVSWVQNGGTLIMTPATGAWQVEKLGELLPDDSFVRQPLQHEHYLLNELGIPLPRDGKWGTKIEGSFAGKTISKEYFPATPSLKFQDGFSTYVFPKNSFSGAKVLAEFTQPESIAGSPCALEIKVGKGKVILFSQYPRTVETELYSGLLANLNVPKYISFAEENAGRDICFSKMLGYVLKVSDGSYVLMTQHANNAPDPHFKPLASKEKEPFRRFVKAHSLPRGVYEVFEITNGKKLLGVFSADDLSGKGIPDEFRFNELNIYHLIKK